MTHFEAYEDLAGKWRWRLIAADHTVVASSAEAFNSQAEAVRAARAVKSHAAEGDVSTAAGIGTEALLRFRTLLRGEAERPGQSPPKRQRLRLVHAPATQRRLGAPRASVPRRP